MFAPDRRWAPATLPFSITATGTSPSFSVSSGSFSSSCMSLLAQARPAGPPPTIAIPTSIGSSGASVGGPMTLAESNGGGNSLGATAGMRSGSLLGFDRLGQLGDDLVQIADHAEVGELEDRRVRVLVDGKDVLRVLHADLVLDRAGDAGRQVQLRRDALAGLADLGGVGVPAGVDDRAGRGDGAAHRLGEFLAELEALCGTETAAAADEDVGVLDVDVGAALLAALDHLRLGRPLRELDVDVDDLSRAAGLLGVEGVEAADDDARLADVADVGDLRVLQDRPLGDQLPVLDFDRGDLHRHAGAEARRESGADLEAEQAAAEEGVAEALLGDDLGHRVDDRLGQALGHALGPVDLGGAVDAERRAGGVGDVAHHQRGSLAADFAGQLGGLGDRPERVLVEVALVVVEGVNQDACHLDQLPLVEPGDDLFDRLVGVLVLDDLAGLLGGRRVQRQHAGLRAGLADLAGVDADVAGALRVERFLFRAHDRFEARVARLVDRVADADHGRQLDLDGVVAVLGLGLAAQLAVGDVDLDHLGQRGHLQVVGDDGADRVALAVIGLLAEQDQVRALGLEHLRQRVAGGADVGAVEGVVGQVHGAVGAEGDGLVQGADGGVGAHRHGDDLLDRDRPALLDLHGRLEGVGIERVEVFLAATVQSHRVGVDALLDCGVRYLLDQDADLQSSSLLGDDSRSSRAADTAPRRAHRGRGMLSGQAV